jgi:hypothetical protein
VVSRNVPDIHLKMDMILIQTVGETFMRRVIAPLTLLVLMVIAQGCARDAAPPNTAAPKEGAAVPPASAAKPSPSPNDPAIKPPTKENK